MFQHYIYDKIGFYPAFDKPTVYLSAHEDIIGRLDPFAAFLGGHGDRTRTEEMWPFHSYQIHIGETATRERLGKLQPGRQRPSQTLERVFELLEKPER